MAGTASTSWTNATVRSFSRLITIDKTKVPNTDQTDFPVLFSGVYPFLAYQSRGGKAITGNSGFDIGFYTDSALTTKLNWETVYYDSATGTVEYWIKIPTLTTATNYTFYIGYGNASITSDQSNPTAVWTNSFLAVYHLKDGTTLSPNDSTSGANNMTNNSAFPVGGKIDGGAGLVRASTQHLALGTALASAYPLTISGWFNPTGTSTNGVIAGLAKPAANDGRKLLYAFSGTLKLYSQDATTGFSFPGATVGYLPNTWYLGHAVFSSSTSFTIYQNGGNSATDTTSVAFGAPTSSYIGRDNDPTNYFDGFVDEIRFANVARSADWIATEYNNQNSPSTFYSVGSENTL